MSKRPSGKKTRSASAPSAAATTRPEFHWTAPARWSWLLGLGVLLAVALFLRWHFFDFPLERDESAYAYLGKRVLDGQVPYRDMYEMKPPLLFYSYAALVAVFGYSAGGIHLAAFVLTLWNAIWLMAVGARLFGLFYGFVAGLCWVLLTANPAANAILLESELLIMAWVLPGLYCLLRWDAAPGAGAGKWWLLASGFLLACGILVKQSALFFLGAPAMLLLWRYWTERPRQLAGLVRNAGWFAAGVLGPVVFFGLLLWSQGAWSDFWFWNVQYLSVYSSGLKKDLWLQAFTFNFDLLTRGFGLYWLLGLVGLFTLLRPGLPGRHRALLFGLLLFAAAAVVPGWRFYAHYWLQLLPVLALLIALQFYQIERGAARVFTQRHPRLLVAGLAVILLVTPVLQNGVLLFKSDHDRTIRSLFPGNPYAEDKTLAGLIGSKIR
ncbi:MAG: glycosyltransferase family 39 protein, partial [Saprospiraceae bacterium]|nr:glycosyltransferase family 39 protein [Saprospiraceae bacterium]